MLADCWKADLRGVHSPRDRVRTGFILRAENDHPRQGLFCSALAALLALFLTLPCWAQITAITNTTQTPTPGAGHNYIKFFNETVNPANGSVSLRIHVPVPPDLGQPISLQLRLRFRLGVPCGSQYCSRTSRVAVRPAFPGRRRMELHLAHAQRPNRLSGD